jgi:hypothetical protein
VIKIPETVVQKIIKYYGNIFFSFTFAIFSPECFGYRGIIHKLHLSLGARDRHTTIIKKAYVLREKIHFSELFFYSSEKQKVMGMSEDRSNIVA